MRDSIPPSFDGGDPTPAPASATSCFLLPSGAKPASLEVQIGLTDQLARLRLRTL
ncbi:MAG TPA: hypothetical protein VIM10_12825 [Actinopolymorphaceae bacterium]|jgi:hypothetical protein